MASRPAHSIRPVRSELLAGNLQKLKMAVLYGADAVYLGTPDLSLRTKSDFSPEDVVTVVEFAHMHNVRVYLTLNLFSHNKDVPKLQKYVNTVRKVKPDRVIIADPGVFQYVKEHAPDLELHISTQANICSRLSVKFWEEQGAKLCVLAREVSFAELKEIREKCPEVKIESFVHGAMCMTYSDRLISSTDEENKDRKFKTPRLGVEGCCGRGCNGCLVFWNDPSYTKACELMADKKQGEMLPKNSRRKVDIGVVAE